jgi:hypothetical protein
MQKEIASAGLLAAIFLLCTLVVYIPQLEVLKAFGVEARLRQTMNEAVATLENLKRLSALSGAHSLNPQQGQLPVGEKTAASLVAEPVGVASQIR